MSPLRIVILVILFYIAIRLLTAGRRKKVAPKKERPEQLSDVLEEDPVCGRLVPRQQAVQFRQHGNTYYFCSQACCDTFSKEQGDQQ